MKRTKTNAAGSSGRFRRWIVLLFLAPFSACASGTPSADAALDLELMVGQSQQTTRLLGTLDSLEARACPVSRDHPPVLWRPFGGEPDSYRVDPTSRFRIAPRPVAFRLSRLDRPADGSSGEPASAAGRVVVRARFREEDHQSLEDYREAHRACTVLIFVSGRVEWIDPNRSDWSLWIPLGVYPSDAALLEEIEGAGAAGQVAIERAAWPEADAAEAATERSRRRSLEALACDDGFRQEFLRSHPDALGLLQDELAEIRCEDLEPVRTPAPGHPGTARDDGSSLTLGDP